MRVIVLGGGPGGYVAAIRAAQFGAQVTLIEEAEVGGTCLNWGCIPTKALVASAELLRAVRKSPDYGIDISGTVTPNLSRIMERKDAVVSTLVKGIRGLLKSWGINLIEGRGVLADERTITVEQREGTGETISGDRIIIATGSRPAQISTFPFDGENILSSDHLFSLKEIPKHMVIIGAGPIGCEFASIFRELGTAVTMVEMQPRVLPGEDIEISELIEREFKKKKITVMTGVTVSRVDKQPDGLQVVLSNGSVILTEKLLVSIGRALNSDRIGIEKAGIQTGPKGEIIVSKQMETNIEGIYAVGDVVGGMLLAHVASREGVVAASNACGRKATVDYSAVPAAIFITPEIASVGLREHEAEKQGRPVRKGHIPFRAIGKSHATGEVTGFVKIIADATTDKILGAHIAGAHASDLIHEITLAMHAGMPAQAIADTIHAHPTVSEGLAEAAEDVYGKAIHKPRK